MLPELRATQVEQSLLMSPAQTLYFRTNFDLDGTPIPKSFRKVSLPGAIAFLFRSRAEVLELPEPLWVRFLPINAWLAVAWRISGFARLRNRRARTYAIENNAPSIVIFGTRTPPRVIEMLGLFAIGLVFRGLYEKVAFGTPGAASAYSQLPLSRGITSTIIPALPAEDDGARKLIPRPASVVFLGHLDNRKGVTALLASWPEVEKAIPNATLTIIGDGPLSQRVSDWANDAAPSRRFAGKLPHLDAVREVSLASVLVAPSRRQGRWREQVGLPIVEGLAAGLTVVASDDTGLANWLATHGHHVINPPFGAALDEALIQAITHPLARTAVLDSLPLLHGRLEADRWIHND